MLTEDDMIVRIRSKESTRLVTQAGYPFHHIEITGFQRKLSLHNIKRNIVTLWNLALSGPKAKAIMKEVQPDLVIGCGGYVSGPVVRCAAKMGIHTALHEQNAFPGVTNKLLAPDVDIVFAAVPAAVEKLGAPQKTIVVGNPVRPEVFTQAKNRDAIRAQLGAGDRTVILSFGGSLGARRVNEVVGDLCAWEQHEHKPVLHLHATGQYPALVLALQERRYPDSSGRTNEINDMGSVSYTHLDVYKRQLSACYPDPR